MMSRHLRASKATLASLLMLSGLIAVPSMADPLSAVSPARSAEPVILTGASFPGWSSGPEVTVREPQPSNLSTTSDCAPGSGEYEDNKDHNCYQEPRVRLTASSVKPGADVNSLIGYRWDGDNFVQIPFQVDERFTRYLTNNNSGFAFYSGADKHTTYAFDREGWRFTESDASNPCLAAPRDGQATMADPIPGLDDNDELVFMYSDSAGRAPAGADLPTGIIGSHEVALTDPMTTETTFAYVMLSGPGGPTPAFDGSNGYVRYERDADADTFLYSQSSYGDYGAAPAGAYWDPTTATCVTATPKQRRPKDTAWITTPGYKFRYDGRWVMNELRISPDGGETYGPDLIDQWKARAFQQRPGGEMPCCGYEEEVNNWGGSSILLGELSGPVRAVRETWGADSATNNIRREIFYRDEVRQQNQLRVHVIPPGDGIYVQWDYNAGRMTKYYNPFVPEGVDVDGANDEVFGNFYGHADSEGLQFRDDDPIPVVGPQDVKVGSPQEGNGCQLDSCIDNDFDMHDPTFSGPHGALNWEQISGPWGTLVTRWTKFEVTAGNAYQVTTFPYYRDDSCFDDGTGTNPGPHLNPRRVDNGAFASYNGQPRTCWTPANGIPTGADSDKQWWQGDIATHGLHVNLIADSDNAMLTEPVTELTSEYRMVTIPGVHGNIGDRWGRSADEPLVVAVV